MRNILIQVNFKGGKEMFIHPLGYNEYDFIKKIIENKVFIIYFGLSIDEKVVNLYILKRGEDFTKVYEWNEDGRAYENKRGLDNRYAFMEFELILKSMRNIKNVEK